MLQLVGVFRSVGFLKYRVVFGSRKPYLASELQDPSLTLFYNFPFIFSFNTTLLFNYYNKRLLLEGIKDTTN